ncbi:MAG: MBL fold metallo-hydrolase [Nitrososphaerales archaeon]
MTKLTFLGTGGSVVTKNRSCAGILFEDKLLDIGFGVLKNLAKSRIEINEINQVYISHTHSDHIGDFTGLIWSMAIKQRSKALEVICSPGTARSLKTILELQATPKKGFVNFEIRFLTPVKAGVPTQRTIHDPPNLAFKFKVNGTRFVYSGDTAKCKALERFAIGSDLLIYESTFLSNQKELARITKHSTAGQAGETASHAKVSELVLMHFAPSSEGVEEEYKKQAQSTFPDKVTLAEDLLSLNL